MGKYGVHGGHNPKGKTASGAVGLVDESTENRNVKNATINKLKELKHTVIDCTIDNAVSVSDCVNKQVRKSNAQTLDLTTAIHFNSGANNKNGDGKTTGVEVFICSEKCRTQAQKICDNLASLGFKNRGVKKTTKLGFLNGTIAPALLVEVCFVDDKDDIDLYKRLGVGKIGDAIAYGMLKQNIPKTPVPPANNNSSNTSTSGTIYRVLVGSYSDRTNADKQLQLAKSKGFTDACIVLK